MTLPKIKIGMLPHEFETEIYHLVGQNHQFTLRGIQHAENEYVHHIEKEFAGDQETIGSQMSHAETFFDDLRRAANHTALVSLVTRLDHWTRKFVKCTEKLGTEYKLGTDKLSTDKQRPHVVRDMETLNARLGAAPVSVQFFKELVTARDSVIHGDSQAQWKDDRGRLRRVADKYVSDDGKLDFTVQHLHDAIKAATTQVKWYDEQIAARKSSATK